MKQLLGYLFAGLIAGILCQNLEVLTSHCYNTSSGRTCFTTFLDNNSRAVRKPFDTAIGWCKAHVPGSSLIMINSLEEEITVGVFIGRQALANQTIIIDAQRLSETIKFEWIWTSGHTEIPKEVENKAFNSDDGACVELKHGQSLTYCVGAFSISYRYICVFSESRICPRNPSHRHNDKCYVAFENLVTWFDARLECLRLEGDLLTHTDLDTVGNWSWLQKDKKYWIGLLQKKWIWKSTGGALTYANWIGGYPNAYDNRQCICIHPRCRTNNSKTISCDNDRKWRICNCSNSYAIVCQKGEETVAATKTTIDTTVSNSTDSTLHTTDFTEGETTVSKISSSGQLNSFSAKQILLVVLLLAATIFIIVTVVLIFRRHKLRNSGSPTKHKKTSGAVSSVYSTVIPENRPPDDTSPHGGAIYTDVEMMQRPTPTNNAIYARVQPSGEAVDMGRNVVYADLDLPKKDRRKPRSSDQIISSLNPIYAQPFEPPCSTNEIYYSLERV